jgi:glycosyltransferase involved in cell wall biosynthesis
MTDTEQSSTEFDGIETVHFHQIKLNKLSEKKRFLLSLLLRVPAVSHQFTRKPVIAQLGELLKGISGDGRNSVFLFEHLAPCAAWFKVRGDFPSAQICFRSHDILTLAFRELAERSGFGMKQLLNWEVRRIQWLEEAMFAAADHVWAITEENREEYRENLGLECDGVVGVEIDVERYRNVEEGDSTMVLHLGGHDMRKMQGLRRLIENVWPLVRAQQPDARLCLGGRGSERLNDPKKGIEGMGFVEDECEFLSKGAIFVNPQESGSGIKLKSLNALAAGKVLIAKQNGVQGVGGRNHQDYWAADSDEEMAEFILNMIENKDQRCATAESGRALIEANYSRTSFEAKNLPLICGLLVTEINPIETEI